ncbi:MAG: NYN domain-containing protein [Microbacteriaceae bacterium]|nr:NYN domain-containing protein [Microbacteriaceae bacterium]
MADPRVAVYIDFDNIVISRYDQLFGQGAWRKDNARESTMGAKSADAVGKRLDEARVDIGVILDYATTFGSVAVTRAYADWSAPANASYQIQLVDRSVDLTQLFNVSGTKNGADIRLAVDVVDDLFRFDSITQVVIVAGDSDYIPLVTRCKRMGRAVIGIGITGSTSRAFVKACDEFTYYDEVPGVPKAAAQPTAGRGSATRKPRVEAAADEAEPQAAATELLRRALQLVDDKNDEEWQTNGEVKNQMIRLDPSFKEKPLGYKSFTEFLESRAAAGVIEIKPKSKANDRRLKLR